MIVVGGAYVEITEVPDSRTVAGSGLRGAGSLGALGDVELRCAVDDALRDETEVVAGGLGINLEAVRRDQQVAFNYYTPMSAPSIDGPGAAHEEAIQADADTVLMFGMIEHGERQVRCRSAIVDPQRPRDLAGLPLDGVQADRTALVCNRSEVRAIGQSADLLVAARDARSRLGTPVVVVKRGALGASVLVEDAFVHVGPHPTATVWPIGSGDVFAAAFAESWGRGDDPVDAAQIGSAAAAWWCGTRNPTVPKSLLTGEQDPMDLVGIAIDLIEQPLVYLAAPFFCLSQRWLVDTTREALAGLGADVFSPLHDVGAGGDEVAVADLAGLARAGSVLALIDGFDAGTLYECGWAHHADIPVVAFGADPLTEGAKMLVGTGAELHADFASAIYRSVWAAMGVAPRAGRVGHFDA